LGTPKCIFASSRYAACLLTQLRRSRGGGSPVKSTGWLAKLKTRIHTAQQRAALAVNRGLMLRCWQGGRDILERQSINNSQVVGYSHIRLGWQKTPTKRVIAQQLFFIL